MMIEPKALMLMAAVMGCLNLLGIVVVVLLTP